MHKEEAMGDICLLQKDCSALLDQGLSLLWIPFLSVAKPYFCACVFYQCLCAHCVWRENTKEWKSVATTVIAEQKSKNERSGMENTWKHWFCFRNHTRQSDTLKSLEKFREETFQKCPYMQQPRVAEYPHAQLIWHTAEVRLCLLMLY